MDLDAKYKTIMLMLTAETSPTMREVAAAIGTSHGSAQERIDRLITAGLARRGAKGQPRTLRLTELGKMRLEGLTKQKQTV